MDVDKALEVMASRGYPGWYDDVFYAGPVLADEVKRLRAVVGNKDAAIEMLANTIDKLRAELAAAKAAGVPVEVAEIREVFFPNQNPMWSVDVRFMYLEERAAFATWLRQQLKQSGKNIPIDFGPLVDDRLEARRKGARGE